MLVKKGAFIDVKTHTNSDFIGLVPTNQAQSGKYCVIIWSKAFKRIIFKINFSKRVKWCFMTVSHFVVVLANQINIYDQTNFTLELKKEIGGLIVQSKVIHVVGSDFLTFLEEKSGFVKR